ncbi:hypothetical protein DSO57_1024618 [Entomophthora muscae]|uniref:Uncharacterized protein n=1 Tax=Entomophthora muscae TaxID=34485 RepID=A0ACC2T2K8_9FUNG|nr:hypothetical protein DSO57_1024618 [Entomophthora muscae]
MEFSGIFDWLLGKSNLGWLGRKFDFIKRASGWASKCSLELGLRRPTPGQTRILSEVSENVEGNIFSI